MSLARIVDGTSSGVSSGLQLADTSYGQTSVTIGTATQLCTSSFKTIGCVLLCLN